MDLSRAFRFSSILLTAAAFTGLILTRALPIALVLLGLVALTVSLLQMSHWGAGWSVFHWSRQTWNTLVVLAFLAFLTDFLWISQDLLHAGVHFLILLMVNKVFNLHQRRDYLHLYAISLLMLLATAALTVEMWYAGVFLVYLLAAIWTLLLYSLRNEVEEAVKRGGGDAPGGMIELPITRRFFWATNGIAIGAFCLTLVIFFTIPRIGAGFFQRDRLDVVRTSGFSEKVDLSEIGAIKLDQTVVMRVEFSEPGSWFGARPPGELLYFRGAAYDHYDGRTWSNTLSSRRSMLRGADGSFHPPYRLRHPQITIRQDILLEPLDTSALFGVSVIESIRGNVSLVQVDAMGNFYLPYPPATRLQYSVNSVLQPIRAEERRAATISYPPQILRRFLQLPPLSPRVRDLAREVTQDVESVFDKVLAIERHLRENYRYSLDVAAQARAPQAGTGSPRPAPAAGAGGVERNPVEEFLFVRKSGYCEHYATAMVVLLRSVGIPARLLTGFLPGEWNEYGSYYTIRQRDAHAWVEVYFPNSGWVTFDPTPAELQTPRETVLSGMRRMFDSVRLKWDRFIIRYSFRDQAAIAQELRERGERARAEAAHWLTSLRRQAREGEAWLGGLVGSAGGQVLLAGVLLAAGALAVWLVRRHGWRPAALRGRAPEEAAIVRLYLAMLRQLRSCGFEKPPGATALEFGRRVGREWGEARPTVEHVTELYCRVRFGRQPVTREDLRRAEDLIGALKGYARRER